MSIKNIVSLALVLLFIMISCIPIDKTVGDQFVPGDYILKVRTASLPLKITNKMPDSIQSTSTVMMIGHLDDPIFGLTTSSTAVQILPYSDTSDFGDSQQIKSVLLKLIVGSTTNYSDKDEGIAQNISVYQLKKDLANAEFNTSITIDDCYPDPIHLGAPVYYGGDTIGISLSNTFGEELLKTTPADFEDPAKEEFLKRIKGLYITSDVPQEIKKGGRLNFLPVGSSTLILNFSMSDAEQKLVNRDTSERFAVGYNFALNEVNSGSDAYESDELKETIYIDGYNGVKPYMSGAELKEQLETWLKTEDYSNTSIILSKASVTLPFEVPSDYIDLDKRFPKSIYPCKIDTSYYFQPLKEIRNSINNQEMNIGLINRNVMTYSCDITLYIQDLMKKDLTEVNSSDDLWFSSTLSTQNEYGNVIFMFDTQNYYNGYLNGPNFADEKRRPTLSIVFTVLTDQD